MKQATRISLSRVAMGVGLVMTLGISAGWARQDAASATTPPAKSTGKSTLEAAGVAADESVQLRRVVEFETRTDSGGPWQGTLRAEAIRMRVEDGDIRVWIDDDEVGADRVEQREGRIVILDEQGNVVRELELEARRGNLPFGWRFKVGEDDQALLRGLEASAEQPKVMIGVHVGPPGAALERHLGLEPQSATMLTAVYEGLPAHAAGLGEFDVITAIDGARPCPPEMFGRIIAEHEPGAIVRMAVISAGKPGHVEVRLEAYDAERLDAATVIGQAPQRMMSIQGVLKGMRGPTAGGKREHQILMMTPGLGDDVNIDNVFVDDEMRVFELPFGHRYGPDFGAGEGAWDARFEALDARIVELERMLERALQSMRAAPHGGE